MWILCQKADNAAAEIANSASFKLDLRFIFALAGISLCTLNKKKTVIEICYLNISSLHLFGIRCIEVLNASLAVD